LAYFAPFFAPIQFSMGLFSETCGTKRESDLI
jgi:hypothetical protein